jgi:hypothetical protein
MIPIGMQFAGRPWLALRAILNVAVVPGPWVPIACLARRQNMPHPVHSQAATNTPAGKNQRTDQEFGEGDDIGTPQSAIETFIAISR